MITYQRLNVLHLKIKINKENIHYKKEEDDLYEKEYIPADHKKFKFCFCKQI